MLEEVDLDGIERGIQDAETVLWWGEYRGSARDLYEKKMREWRAGTLVPLAVLDGESFAGHIFLELRDDDIAVISFWLVPEARGRGLATRSVQLLTRWTFARLGAARIELWIEPGNERSRGVAERAGFIREGLLRSAGVRDGRRFDKEVFSLLVDDPAT